ncbi:MAG: InlB B-repeat-containing protein, partial [Paludibacteraceae bacterium]|nr:InlB B-repeat-containing protein [Paludibacteraceae bacterium]
MMLPLFSAVHAQSTSGTEFWMAFLQNVDKDLDKPYYLSVLLTSTEATEVNISSPTGYSQTVTLDRNSSKRIEIPFDEFNVTEYGEPSNKTLHITSTNPISVYAENYQDCSNDATLVLPISACGSYYIIQNNVGRSESSNYVFMPATFSVIAFEDDTEVEIIPSLTTDTGQEKGEPYTITLKEGEVFQLASQKSDQGSGLSGSQIRVLKGKKVAVYAGNRCTNVPDACTAGDSDMLFEVQYPVSSWGKDFIIQPFASDINDMVKCTACKDGTKIYKDGELIATLDAFESYEFYVRELDGPFMVEASEPIALYQYMTSSSFNVTTARRTGGPSFQYLVPLEQSIEKITFSTLDNDKVLNHYVNIVIKKEDISTVTLNGQTDFATFTPINDEYATATVRLNAGQYTLEAKSGFIANVYGTGAYVSYSYVAGSKMEDINASEGEYLVTYDGNGATSGTMPNHHFDIGTDETTKLDANKFKRSHTVSFDTKGGEEIADEQVDYTFKNWIHEELLTEITNNMQGNWHNISTYRSSEEDLGLISVSTADSVNSISVDPEVSVRERLYSEPIYMPAGDFDLAFEVCSPSGYSNLEQSSSWEATFKVSACDQPQEVYCNDLGIITKGNAESAVAVDCYSPSTEMVDRDFSIYSTGETPVYIAINCGNLLDGKHSEFKFSDFTLSKDGSTSLLYKDKEPTVNMVRERGGVVALKAQWEPDSLELPLPIKEGYTFAGWTTQADGTTAEYQAGDFYTPEDDVTIYAIWSNCEKKEVEIQASICEGESYTLGTKEYSTSGEYVWEGETTEGCDSIVTLKLEVNPTFITSLSDQVTLGSTYTKNGFDLPQQTSTGTFNHQLKLESQYGCDSIVDLELTVIEKPDEFACENGTILFQEDFGGNFVGDPALGPGLPAGMVTLQFSNHIWDRLKNGYDIRKEAIRRRDNNPRNHIYAGWYADFGDHTHEDDLTRGYFMTIDLDYLEATFYKVQVNDLCENTKLYFTFWGHPLNASADAPLTLTLEDLNGNLLKEEVFTINCSNNAWQQFGMPFNVPEGETSIVYKVHSGAGGNGGDFALDDIEIRLCTPPVDVNVPEDSLCINSKYTMTARVDDPNSSLVEPITYTWFKNKEKNYNNEGWEKIHVGKSLELGEITEENEGYYKVFATSAGVEGEYSMCSGSFSNIVSLMISDCKVDTLIYDTICHGATYAIEGKEFNETGTYTLELKASTGVDSTVILDLTVLDEITTELKESICEGSSFTFDGQELTASGEYTATYTSASGCDSLVTLVLEILPIYDDTTSATIIQGKSYTFAGNTYDEEGTYTTRLQTTAGCDSIVTLKLNILNGSSDTIKAAICQGETYQSYGFDESTAGTFTQQLKNTAGGDSLVTLVLELLPIYDDTTSATIIEGESYTFAGNTYDEEGTYTTRLQTTAGCDSIVTLKLSVVIGTSDTIKAAICQGETYQSYGFDESTAGTFTQQLKNVAGADSIVTLVLEILPIHRDTITDEFCAGDTYNKHGFNVTEAGTHLNELKNVHGCDSIIVLILKELTSYTETITDTICEGESYDGNGFSLTNTSVGITTESLSYLPEYGCDSV